MIECERCGSTFENARLYSAHSRRNCDVALAAKRVDAEDLIDVTGEESIELNRCGIAYRYEKLTRHERGAGAAICAVAPRWTALAMRAIRGEGFWRAPELLSTTPELITQDQARLLRIVFDRGRDDEAFRDACATICQLEPAGLAPYLRGVGITPGQWMTPPTCRGCNRPESWSDEWGAWRCETKRCALYLAPRRLLDDEESET
jgi:uncharacterized C2H2 Zn-finger protein